MGAQRFELHRDADVTGVSGTGMVAEGVVFSDGTVALRWCSEWPTSVVFHDRGIEAVRKVHGHGGATRIVWLDVPGPPAPALSYESMWAELSGYVSEAVANPKGDDAAQIMAVMKDLKGRQLVPIKAWMGSMADSPHANLRGPSASGERKPCPSVHCPPWTEGGLTVEAVCNCHVRWGHWGNPWGDPDCPVHGELVRANVERGRTVAPVELEVGRSHEGGRA